MHSSPPRSNRSCWIETSSSRSRRHVFAQQQADEGIEFVDFAQRVDACAVLAGAAAVAEAGAAVVAGARGDFGKSIAHDYVLP
jgi:hypothetical protein